MKRFFSTTSFLFVTVILLAQNLARTGKDYAYFFYVSNFDQPTWTSLPETQSEAEAIAGELKSNYGFQVVIFPNPTKAEIEESLLEAGKRRYGPNDQFLFFFSSHGHFIEDEDRGFFIPRDGKAKSNDPLLKSWLSYEDLGGYITRIKCQHILVSLDACYSGAFGDRWKAKPFGFEELDDCSNVEINALHKASRLYYTSGSKVQKTPAQSKFAKAWLNTLQNGEGQILTTNELNYSFGRIDYPQPEGGTFTKAHKGGDFVFFHKNACKQNNESMTDQAHWLSIQSKFSKTNIERHIQRFPGCEHQAVLESLGLGETKEKTEDVSRTKPSEKDEEEPSVRTKRRNYFAGNVGRTITGLVTDSNGEPLIGTSILLVGTNYGAISDIEGEFSLSVVEEASQIQFSHVGYITQTVKITSENSIKVVMEEDAPKGFRRLFKKN